MRLIVAGIFRFQSIVGYAQNGLGEGFTPTGAQFFPIAGEGIAIKDFQFVPNSGSMYDFSIQTLDKDGFAVDNLIWNDWTEYPADSGEYPGFWDNNFEGVPSTLVVKPGDGLWILGGSAKDTVQTAGQVGSDDFVTTWTESGFKLVANPYPVAVSINDIVFTPVDSMYSFSIQTLDKDGITVDNLIWDDWTEYPAGSGEYPGFWDNNFEGIPSTLSLQPGQAVWIFANEGDAIRIPAPEL